MPYGSDILGDSIGTRDLLRRGALNLRRLNLPPGGLLIAGIPQFDQNMDLHLQDNDAIFFGDDDDSSILFNATDLIINPTAGGSSVGDVIINVDGDSDSGALAFGAASGGDARIYYDGTSLVLNTDNTVQILNDTISGSHNFLGIPFVKITFASTAPQVDINGTLQAANYRVDADTGEFQDSSGNARIVFNRSSPVGNTQFDCESPFDTGVNAIAWGFEEASAVDVGLGLRIRHKSNTASPSSIAGFGGDPAVTWSGTGTATLVTGGGFALDIGGTGTATTIQGLFGRTRISGAATVTTARAILALAPDFSGAQPTNSSGVVIENQGVSGVTLAIGADIEAQSGATTNLHLRTQGVGGVVFNEDGADTDLRIEGDTATSLFVCDAGLEAVQIGTTTAGALLDLRPASTVFNEASADIDLRIEGNGDANLVFVDAGNDTVGIGENPGTDGKLSIDQTSSTGAKPVLKLDQADLSEQCIQFSSDATDRDINLFTVDVTGTPTLLWDESEDDFNFSKGITAVERVIVDGTVNEVQLTVQAHSTQTANLQTWENSSGTDLMAVGPDGELNFGPSAELTISAGVVTATKTWHTIDTEADAGTDDLDTINGGTAGDILILQSVTSARDPTAKDSVDNLTLAGDFTFATSADVLVLLFTGATWVEVSRSTN